MQKTVCKSINKQQFNYTEIFEKEKRKKGGTYLMKMLKERLIKPQWPCQKKISHAKIA